MLFASGKLLGEPMRHVRRVRAEQQLMRIRPLSEPRPEFASEVACQFLGLVVVDASDAQPAELRVPAQIVWRFEPKGVHLSADEPFNPWEQMRRFADLGPGAVTLGWSRSDRPRRHGHRA